jgi:hypothetical protein
MLLKINSSNKWAYAGPPIKFINYGIVYNKAIRISSSSFYNDSIKGRRMALLFSAPKAMAMEGKFFIDF